MSSSQQERKNGTSSTNPNDISLDNRGNEAHHMIIWRDRESIEKCSSSSTTMSTSSSQTEVDERHIAMEDLDENKGMVFVKFTKAHHCYDLIPTSSKLLVFDTELGVRKAFFALVYNGLRAAPLWDSSQRNFVGMLTITDFIKILQKYYKPSSEQGLSNDLEEQKISTWRDELHEVRPIVSIGPEASLFEAVLSLCHYKVHRLPVIDSITGNVLYILTHKRILRFLYLYIYDLPLPSFIHQTLGELDIGTYRDVITVSQKTPLIDAINLFVSKRISALPVVDNNNQIIDLYAKFDVLNLAVNQSYSNLDVSISEAIANRKEKLEGVLTCRRSETLKTIMDRIVKAEVHRLVVVDESNQVEGIVSLSDLLRFLVLRPSDVSQDLDQKVAGIV